MKMKSNNKLAALLSAPIIGAIALLGGCDSAEVESTINAGAISSGEACPLWVRQIGEQSALQGVATSPAGVVTDPTLYGADFVTAGLNVNMHSLDNGARIYEVDTVMEREVRQAETLDDLRIQFGSALQDVPINGGSRTGVGYQRAEFTPTNSCSLNQVFPIAAPALDNVDNFPAVTRWNIIYRRDEFAVVPTGTGAGFRFDGTKLSANISTQIKMPIWGISTTTPVSAITEWNGFSCALGSHESLHAETVRTLARRLLEESTSLRGATPEALIEQYDCLWQQGIEWAKNEDIRIDSYTGHGPKL